MRSSPCVLNHKPACQDNQDKKTTTVWPNVLLHVLHLFLFQSTCLKKSLNFTIFLWQRQGLRFSGAWTVPAKTLGIPSKKTCTCHHHTSILERCQMVHGSSDSSDYSGHDYCIDTVSTLLGTYTHTHMYIYTIYSYIIYIKTHLQCHFLW